MRLLGLEQRKALNGKTGRICTWHADIERVGVCLDVSESAGQQQMLAVLLRNLEEVLELASVNTDLLGGILEHVGV